MWKIDNPITQIRNTNKSTGGELNFEALTTNMHTTCVIIMQMEGAVTNKLNSSSTHPVIETDDALLLRV